MALAWQGPAMALPWLLPALLPGIAAPGKVAKGRRWSCSRAPLLPMGQGLPAADKGKKNLPGPPCPHCSIGRVWRQEAACGLQHLLGAVVRGRGCLGRAGPARCACTAGVTACQCLYPAHSLLAHVLTPKMGHRSLPSLSFTSAAWGWLLSARAPSRMDLTGFFIPPLSASFSTKKGSGLGPAAGCLPPRSVPPAPFPEGLGTARNISRVTGWCAGRATSTTAGSGSQLPPPPCSASAFLIHPGRRELDTGRSRRVHFQAGKWHIGQPRADRRPPLCLVAAGDGAARGDVLGAPMVMGTRAQCSLQFRGFLSYWGWVVVAFDARLTLVTESCEYPSPPGEFGKPHQLQRSLVPTPPPAVVGGSLRGGVSADLHGAAFMPHACAPCSEPQCVTLSPRGDGRDPREQKGPARLAHRGEAKGLRLLPLKTSAGEARGREKLFKLPYNVDIRTTRYKLPMNKAGLGITGFFTAGGGELGNYPPAEGWRVLSSALGHNRCLKPLSFAPFLLT